jgi:saccharopine dehydrogenase-like NADP-dependent oxidoreductase
VVVIFVTASGYGWWPADQETYANKVYSAVIGGVMRSAIQITTASGICAVLDLLARASCRRSGFVKQEDIGFDAFLANRFGRGLCPPRGSRPRPR